MSSAPVEFWLTGPVSGVTPLLQPVAHTLLQVQAEVRTMTTAIPAVRLWERPRGLASAGFHLQHMAGVLDRLFTYARGENLNEAQRQFLENEGRDQRQNLPALMTVFDGQIAAALAELRSMDSDRLTEPRGVGRQQIPSTVIGLLVHAAEHLARHSGQLLVTVKGLLCTDCGKTPG